jgi:16S rRNA (uracil1498-N3)-methyltransferase
MKTTPRLHVPESLNEARDIVLTLQQGHYLTAVMRLAGGDPVRVFNGRDGEWLAYIATAAKKVVSIRCEKRLADAAPPPDIDYLFAPLKHARLDYAVQKATELGARRLSPVITARTVAGRVNLARMRANAVEAAEQCNLVYVPEVHEPRQLAVVLAGWEQSRVLIYCDESAAVGDPVAALRVLATPAAVLIGPEGGFTPEEKAQIVSLPSVTAISLGPRIVRADTAGVAALALVQATIGDWRKRT